MNNDKAFEKLISALNLDEDFPKDLLKQWLSAIIRTPLYRDFALADLPEKDCIKEMPFYFSIQDHFDVAAFNRALKAHHTLPSEALNFEQIQGVVRGSIDLVFRHQGKYYFADYKSNFLGERLENYDQESLKCVLHSHYDWQYLIYTVALHRYLKSADPHYDYERNFGGVFYLFLRGMHGEGQSGIFFDCPSVELINELEHVF